MKSDPLQQQSAAAQEQQTPRRPDYLGEPSLGSVMRRPRWILALLLALLVAAGFAALGRWQMGNAIRSDDLSAVDTETARPLSELTDTSRGVSEAAGGMVVELGGSFVAGDLFVVSPRENDGEAGAWVVGHLIADGEGAEPGASLAVAIGWAPTEADAQRAADELGADPAFAVDTRVEGRYMPPDGPQAPKADQDPQRMSAMVPAHFANAWEGLEGPVYSGYLVLHADPDGIGPASLLASAGLDPVDSLPPLPPEQVNWLNVFYAVEWIVFGGFAIFFWFRLTRDAWEKEHELKLLLAEAEDGPDPESGDDSRAEDRIDPATEALADTDHRPRAQE